MNPYYPGVPGPPVATPAPPRSEEELRQALKTSDTLLSDLRAQLDNHARGRRYDALAKCAVKVKEVGELAHKQQQDLDQIQTQAKR